MIENYPYGNPFKYKSLKSYISKEFMADNSRKYRRVFDKAEISYMRWELCFYNKLFDEQDWTAKVVIKTFKRLENELEEVCSLESEIEVSKEKNEIFVYESWGNKERGTFWKKGTYEVKAYIDDELLGTEYFYVEDVGIVTAAKNPYFDLESLRLYNGDDVAHKQESKKYLKVFNKQKTQYVWVELKIKNKVPTAYTIEFLFNFYDDAGILKLSESSLCDAEAGQSGNTLTYEYGWGQNDRGKVWVDDEYRLDVIFMDTLIASVSFKMDRKEVEGEVLALKDTPLNLRRNQRNNPKYTPKLDVLMHNLDELIGLENIKSQVKEHISYLKFLKLRQNRGLKENTRIDLHSVFTGNPGTGKTTVVKLLGKIYHRMGLLSKGHIHEVDRADLIGKYIGQTAPQVREHIEKARGGILFIDEAYALARSRNDKMDYGLEAIEMLMKEMSDGEGDLAIMVAGYPKEMQTFLEINPGLKSRFQYHFKFDDYTPDELLKIAQYASKKCSVNFEKDAENYIYKMLLDAYRDRDRTFGNARYAYSLVDEAKFNLGLRLIKEPDFQNLLTEKLSLITLEDVKNINLGTTQKSVNIPIDEDLLKLALADLNKLVGMENIKNSINETVKLIRYYKETGKDVLDKMAKHTIFVGNPGTGKTTVARIMSKIYKALGMLERGHLVEVSREDLVAGYTGQTAIRTKEKINESLGGVLFIDEAYSLFERGENNYGKEAIEVILKMMEDKRGQFVIIAAGYPENMDRFLKSNPGLQSRFDRTLQFNDYSPETLSQIAVSMFKENNLNMDESSFDFMNKYIKACFDNRDKYFGNARFVRKIVEETIKQQNLRMADIPKEERTEDMMQHIMVEDVTNIKNIKKDFNPQSKLGFRH